MAKRFFYLLALSGFLAGCVAPRRKSVQVIVPQVPPAVTGKSALIRVDPSSLPSFEDDLDTSSLRTAALRSLTYYRSQPETQMFIFGPDSYSAKELATSMASLLTLLDNIPTTPDWRSELQRTFAVYESIGIDSDRTVTFSSYYEPTVQARLTRGGDFAFPFYARPPDLIDVDLGLFDPAYQGAKIAGRRDGKNLVPYPTRADIDSAHWLDGQGLEIAWAKDPMEVLDLQIEGSGWLDLGNGDLVRIRYDGNNGRHYKSVGQYVIASGRIARQDFNRNRFLQYMKDHAKERQSLLNVNERYIFFRIDRSTASAFAFGNIEVPLTAGRSIATDPQLFPKGALAWIDTAGIKRFMVNQDEGGAILGPGRVDIFAGHGEAAKGFATRMWNKGKLYFLVKRKESPGFQN